MILQLLESLPTSFDKDYDTKSATGAALLASRKLVVRLKYIFIILKVVGL